MRIKKHIQKEEYYIDFETTMFPTSRDPGIISPPLSKEDLKEVATKIIEIL